MNKGNIVKKYGYICYIGDYVNIRRKKRVGGRRVK